MRIWHLVISLLWAVDAFALEALGVLGPVEPAKPHYEKLLISSNPVKGVTLSDEGIERVKNWSGNYAYDSALSSGNFVNKVLSSDQVKNLVAPICLLANDAVSKDWLLRNRHVIEQVKPVCYLVRASSNQDVDEIKGLIPKLKLFAINPTLIIQKFAVQHYPALISDKGVEQ